MKQKKGPVMVNEEVWKIIDEMVDVFKTKPMKVIVRFIMTFTVWIAFAAGWIKSRIYLMKLHLVVRRSYKLGRRRLASILVDSDRIEVISERFGILMKDYIDKIIDGGISLDKIKQEELDTLINKAINDVIY